MSTRAKIITAYFIVALLTTFYLLIWGANAYRGFFFNLGSGLFWPFVIFPGLGKIVGGIIMFGIIAAIMAT